MAHLLTRQVLPLEGARLLGRQPSCPTATDQTHAGPTVEFRSHGILAKAVGILVLAGNGETPSQHCKSLKSPCFSTAERNVGQKLCSN